MAIKLLLLCSNESVASDEVYSACSNGIALIWLFLLLEVLAAVEKIYHSSILYIISTVYT